MGQKFTQVILITAIFGRSPDITWLHLREEQRKGILDYTEAEQNTFLPVINFNTSADVATVAYRERSHRNPSLTNSPHQIYIRWRQRTAFWTDRAALFNFKGDFQHTEKGEVHGKSQTLILKSVTAAQCLVVRVGYQGTVNDNSIDSF